MKGRKEIGGSEKGSNKVYMYIILFILSFLCLFYAYYIWRDHASKSFDGLKYVTFKSMLPVMIGLFLAIAGHINDWAWLGYSTSFSVNLAADDIIGWTLAGLVIAWRIKPLMAKA